MSLYSTFLRHTALPFMFKRYNRSSALRHKKFYDQSQFWSRQQLLDYQFQRLDELLQHAYDSCAFYRRSFDAHGLTPASLKSLDDLSRFPILSRDDVYGHSDELISSRHERDKLLVHYTGGTTGQQAKLYADQESFNIKQALAWRHEGLMGCQPCDKIALFWPAHIDYPEHESWKTKFAQRHIFRLEMIPGGSLNEATARRIADQLCKFRPQYLKVFPVSFYSFIEMAQTYNLPLPRVQGIMATGEVLYSAHRKTMEEVFQCPVHDMYGSREVGNTAAECSAHQGLHIAMETSLVEFVVDGKAVAPGEEGEMLITDLTNYGMPLIRYRINDYGVPLSGDCSCGRGLTRMDATVGRVLDCVYSPDGTRHSGNVLGIHLTTGHDNMAIGQMQFIQKSLTHFLIRLTDKPTPTPETFSFLEQNMKTILGPEVTVAFEVVDSIPQAPSGKTRYVICEIPPPPRR